MADLPTNLQRLDNNSDEILALTSDIADAIVAKGGTLPANAGLRSFADAIENIPNRYVASTEIVRFIDYDGTVLHAYTPEQFAALESLPANPSHTGLTAQGWNWTLSDAKSYVATYGSLFIGQMYITDDGKTRLYITLPEGRTEPILQLYLNKNSELDIDWGDGSTHSTFTSTTAAYKSEKHVYATPGNYVIAISVVAGSIQLKTDASAVSSVLWGGYSNLSSPDSCYNNSINRIEVGSSVTGINGYAFFGCKGITSITIPDSVTSINDHAFTACYSLSSITIPINITKIDEYVFSTCYALSSISIPKKVTRIGSNAIAACYALSSISIPDGVTFIGSGALYSCRSLSSITIPNKVATIEDGAFQSCTSLLSVKIPDSVTSIGSSAFQGCTSLPSITIPDKVTSIEYGVFQGCSSLLSITIPDSVTSIGGSAFYSCTSLSSITIPDNVTSIESSAFYGCGSLSSLTIPDKVTSIGNKTFQNCYSLSSITIPDNVTSIGSNAFYGCAYMKYIRFEPTTPATVSDSNAWTNVASTTIILVPLTSWDSYTNKTNYPNPSTFKYIAYNTYASGETLPSSATDATTSVSYTLTWYATMDDAYNETNPITEGNGNEVYARCVVSA